MNNSPLVIRPNRRKMATIKKRPVTVRMAEAVGTFLNIVAEAFGMLSGALGFILFVLLLVGGAVGGFAYLVASLTEGIR